MSKPMTAERRQEIEAATYADVWELQPPRTDALRELLAEIDRLRAIVETVPMNADGDPIILGGARQWTYGYVREPVIASGIPYMLTVGIKTGPAYVRVRSDDGTWDDQWPAARCYSTADSALAAAKGATK